MKHVILFTLMLFTLAATAQSKEERRIGAFEKIIVSGAIDVYFTQENSTKLIVETDPQIMKSVLSTVENGVLIIKRDKSSHPDLRRNNAVSVYVSSPQLNKLEISGASDFKADKINQAGDFQLMLSGASDTDINSLVASEVLLTAGGASDINIKSLKAKNVKLNVTGSSDAEIAMQLENEVNAIASGSSDLKLSGKVKRLNLKCSGSSDADIRKLTYDNIQSSSTGSSDILK